MMARVPAGVGDVETIDDESPEMKGLMGQWTTRDERTKGATIATIPLPTLPSSSSSAIVDVSILVLLLLLSQLRSFEIVVIASHVAACLRHVQLLPPPSTVAHPVTRVVVVAATEVVVTVAGIAVVTAFLVAVVTSSPKP
ncbi:hypothetical protein U1Q18_032632 [Sarracenia purpurea var. burkii]